MPGLVGRISTMIKAKVSGLVGRAEQPAETLDYAYERELEDLQNVKQGVADVVTAKRRLQLEDGALRDRAEQLAGQARQAMEAGREDLARAALERRQLVTQELATLDQQIAELESEQENLIAAERRLREQVESFRSKKEVIKAQYAAAEAEVSISGAAAAGVGGEAEDLALAMQRAIDKTETMKARAEAVQELEAAGTLEDLTALGPAQDDVDRQLEKLGAGDAVDAEFARLKAEVASTAGFLADAGVPYELVEHVPTTSAAADAEVTGHRPDEAAKVVVLHDEHRYIAAVVAASDRLDMHKVRRLFDASRQLRLASEAEISAEFPQYEVGAMPPLGPGVPPVEVIDRELLRGRRLLCAAGDHRHSVMLEPDDLLRLTSAVTADIRED